MKRSFGAIVITSMLAVPAAAQIVVDHQPTRSGGPASDTQFINQSGFESWQQEADDFSLSDANTVRRINVWGFYDLDNPPTTESMRVRFYSSRPGDGLPGSVLYEQEFASFLRAPTGHIVFVGVDPHEYFYTFDLATPLALSASTTYWLEVVQLGDIDSAFRWESSSSGNRSRVFMNPTFQGWTIATGSDLAFQLYGIPEPASISLLAIGAAAIVGRTREA